MSDPGMMPTFLCNLRHDTASRQFIASVSIVDPVVVGFRGVVRRFNRVEDVVNALESVRIAPNRYNSVLSVIHDGQCHSFEIDVNEAQKLDILQTDTSE
ncbi:hypothetical protein [Edaphobacter aggregans]|uniref:hypothetical protein n=1 Tax=Edaphobacter aggregans TaxID=570835 RepID=UPI00054DECA1|nr:hypothetical protein [Edaphobacter aggregans]